MGDCVFCQIVAGQTPATIIREWVDTIAILPRERNGRRGCTDGHILVIPRAHVPDFITDPVVSAVTALRLSELAGELRDRTGQAFNEITSAGEDATQTVWHLHRHLVPRRPGDGLPLPWTTYDTYEPSDMEW